MARQTSKNSLSHIEAFNPELDAVHAIIETPKGSRNKFDYDEKYGVFQLSGLLPEGSVFPFDFGFVPSTLGGDGDPLDVLVLMDEPATVGCLVPIRLIGVLEAEQSKDGKTERNDRLIAVAVHSHNHSQVRSLKKLKKNVIKEIEQFFVTYEKLWGKKFKILGRFGPRRARKVVKSGCKQFCRKRAKGKKG